MNAIAPRSTTALMSARARAHSQRFLASLGCRELNCALIDRFGNQVLDGPFKGLILSPETLSEQLGPYLFGLYEHQLISVWTEVFSSKFSQIIDVGSKFGFYAVGLALKFPHASVFAFDTDWWARRATLEMKSANRTENLTILGFCSPQWLDRNLRQNALIVSDCEGYESELFSGRVIELFRSATLVIETHDARVPGITNALTERFSPTHRVTLISDSVEVNGICADLNFLDSDQFNLATREIRGSQYWLFCTPRS